MFHTETPAPTWEDGLITGSGRVGGVLFGPADELRLSLSHERFFLPANPRPPAPEIAPALPLIREAILAGDSARASDLVTEAARRSGFDGGLIWTDPLGICATLAIATPGGASEVRRSIDPEHGEVAVSWTDSSGGLHTVRALAPRDSESICVAVEADTDTVTELVLGLTGDAAHALETGAPDYSGAVRATYAIEGDTGRVSTQTADDAMTSTVSASGRLTWARSADGRPLRARLVVASGAQEIIDIGLRVGAQGRTPAGPRPDAAADWATLRARQSSSHGALVRASTLELGGTEFATTEELWGAAHSGDAGARRGAIEAAYLSGRAHAIASTGELPPTLQGVWQGSWKPAWSADYTMNGNVQNGGIAGLIPTGTPELARSLLNLVLPFLDDYRENARRIFGADGMLLPSRMSTHGLANHFHEQFPHLFWVGCGGWVLRFAADLVATTGDRSVVDDRLWQLVEGVLRFGETATFATEDGRSFVPNYSPENAPVPGGSPLIADSTIDVAIYRDAARAALVLADARNDHSLDERWHRFVASLPAYRRADDGTLSEWISPIWPENIAHRHASQLYPLWYELDPAFEGTSHDAAALREAAAATIAAKIAWRAEAPTAPPGRMEMAFGLVQLGLAAAALGDAESALTCVEWLAVDHWRPALTTTHDAGSIFNLDASGGLPALVAAMLLNSTVDRLSILPALPQEWSRGSITGLRARGGIVVDRLEWDEDGCVLTLHRLPEARWLRPDGRVRLQSPRPFLIEGRPPSDGTIVVAEHPLTLRLEWGGTRAPDA
ncbi:glycoside hydrolase N-terminal domain-containing protein [Agromyces sp. NPDC049794]|uniref:glycosyl hydrolase family 95 catalytic domain-containing protein n=1 Tax=unclassified Agromyces TaxID=2639701 RepID=UPI0033FFBFA3